MSVNRRPVSEEKYDKIKEMLLKEDSKYRIMKIHRVSNVTVLRIKNSENYEEYLLNLNEKI